jgi:hypothetical protein
MLSHFCGEPYKKVFWGWAWQCIPVLLATEEAEIEDGGSRPTLGKS